MSVCTVAIPSENNTIALSYILVDYIMIDKNNDHIKQLHSWYDSLTKIILHHFAIIFTFVKLCLYCLIKTVTVEEVK